MQTYKIKLYYETGNSFGTDQAEDYLELTWQNLDVAKENLVAIKEHYTMHQEIESYHKKLTDQQIFKNNSKKGWFVEHIIPVNKKTGCKIEEKAKKILGEGNWEYRIDEYFAKRCINLKTDSGDKMQISAFWTGYFETLHSAEIEIDTSDMKVTF